MQKNNSDIRYKNGKNTLFISVLLTIALIFTSCFGGKKASESKCKKYIDVFFEELVKSNDINTVFMNNSSEKIKTFIITEPVIELEKYALSRLSYDISSFDYDKDKDEASVILKVDYVDFNLVVKELNKGTEDQYRELIDDAKLAVADVKLKVIKNKDAWFFEDLNSLYNLICDGYEKALIIDEKGKFVGINRELFDSTFVGSCFYDALTENPIGNLCQSSNPTDNAGVPTIDKPIAIQAVFYLSKPINFACNARLIKDDNVIDTIDVLLDNDVLLICDFDKGTIDGSIFKGGQYKIELCLGEETLAVTQEISVT